MFDIGKLPMLMQFRTLDKNFTHANMKDFSLKKGFTHPWTIIIDLSEEYFQLWWNM